MELSSDYGNALKLLVGDWCQAGLAVLPLTLACIPSYLLSEGFPQGQLNPNSYTDFAVIAGSLVIGGSFQQPTTAARSSPTQPAQPLTYRLWSCPSKFGLFC